MRRVPNGLLAGAAALLTLAAASPPATPKATVPVTRLAGH
jgi:hypothetical protein